MNQTLNQTVLVQVLDAIAPDQEQWLAGQAAFNAHTDDQQACYAALDAAAPDQEQWQKGYHMFVAAGLLSTEQSRLQNLRDAAFWGKDVPMSHRPLALVLTILMGVAGGLLLGAAGLAALNNLWPSHPGLVGVTLFISMTLIGLAIAGLVLQSARRRSNYYSSATVADDYIDS